MGTNAMPMPVNASPGAILSGPQLYPGGSGTSGMPAPAIGKPQPILNGVTGGGVGAPGGMSATASMPFTPASAPTGLTVNPNPGSTSTLGPPGSSTDATGLNSTEQNNLSRESSNYLGKGYGSLTNEYLQSGAGYNGAIAQQSINATDQAMQQQINQQYGALQSSMAEAGLSPDSSGFQLGQAEFLSNASATENEVAAQQYEQMWSQSQSQYTSLLGELDQIGSGRQASSFGNEFGASFAGGLGQTLSLGFL